MFAAAARRGNAPYAICIDGNEDLMDNNVIRAALMSGQWRNALEGTEDEFKPTYCNHKDWDQVSTRTGATRIDFVFLNSSAWAARRDPRIVRNLSTPAHLAIAMNFDI